MSTPYGVGVQAHVEAFYMVAGDLNSGPHLAQQGLLARMHLTSPLSCEMSIHHHFISR